MNCKQAGWCISCLGRLFVDAGTRISGNFAELHVYFSPHVKRVLLRAGSVICATQGHSCFPGSESNLWWQAQWPSALIITAPPRPVRKMRKFIQTVIHVVRFLLKEFLSTSNTCVTADSSSTSWWRKETCQGEPHPLLIKCLFCPSSQCPVNVKCINQPNF